MKKEMIEGKKRVKSKEDVVSDAVGEVPVLDEDKLHFVIGFKKGSDDQLVIKRLPEGREVNEVEVLVMLLHSAASNTLGFLNRIRLQQEKLKAELVSEKLKAKKDERKPKSKAKKVKD